MRQIINLQLGQCGNNIGLPLLQAISQQHGLDFDGKYIGTDDRQRSHIEVYFKQIATDMYNARTILADLQTGAVDDVIGSKVASLYDPDNFVTEMGSAGNNWAIGYHRKGDQVIERLIDAVRKETDDCESLEGFQIIHSMGGGTGSGLTSKLIERLSEQYPNKITQTFSFYPSPKVSDCIIEPYNTVFAQYRLIENIDLTNVIENESLFRICDKKLKQKGINYKMINLVAAQAIDDLTCGLRFPGQINFGLRKQAVNLIPYPRIHFLTNSYAPLASPQDNTRTGTIKELISDLWSKQNIFTSSHPNPYSLTKTGKYLTTSMTFRGKVSVGEVQKHLNNFKEKRRNKKLFIEWLPNQFQTSYCDIVQPYHPISAVLSVNSSTIRPVFQKINETFNVLFRKKAFMHWYISQGVDEMEFTEVQSNFNDLISQYQWQSYCHCGGEEYDGCSEEDDE